MKSVIAITLKGINDSVGTSATQRIMTSRIVKMRDEDNATMIAGASATRIEYINHENKIDILHVSQTQSQVDALIDSTDNSLTDGSTPQTLTGAGAVNLTTSKTILVSTGAAQALTLADGVEGQEKFILYKTDGGSSVLTPTSKLGFTTITFTAVGDSAKLKFMDGKWNIVSLFGAIAA